MRNYKHQKKHHGIAGMPADMVGLVKRKIKNRKNGKRKKVEGK